MIGWIKGIFDWLDGVGGVLFRGVYDVLRRFKWFAVAVLMALLAPVKWVLEVAKGISAGIANSSSDLLGLVNSLGMGQADSLWGSIGNGAALMNCVVPLDYCLSVFGILLSIWTVILGIKAAVWLYRLIPNIAGFGPGG